MFRHNKSIGTSDLEQMPYDRRTDSYLLNNEIGPECIRVIAIIHLNMF